MIVVIFSVILIQYFYVKEKKLVEIKFYDERFEQATTFASIFHDKFMFFSTSITFFVNFDVKTR